MANLNKVNKGFWWAITQFIYKRRFHTIGKKSIIFHPMRLDSVDSIIINENVFIAQNSWLMGCKNKTISLEIGSRTVIGHYSHIVALNNVKIGKSVLIADKVFISDCTHNYDDISVPIMDQGVVSDKEVVIGDDSWIGENVCVLGSSIGKHCIIGANSVVTKDIPDYCIAAGIPARIIKKYDFQSGKWIKV